MENKILSGLKSYAIISFGILLYTFAVMAFFVPQEVVTGGVTGLSTLIYFISGNTIPVGVSYFAINGILILLSLRVLGANFGIKTVFAMFLGSGLLGVFQIYLPDCFYFYLVRVFYFLKNLFLL